MKSVRFVAEDAIVDFERCIVYIRPLFLENKSAADIDQCIKTLYYKFCRFGAIVGIVLDKCFGHIVFENRTSASIAVRLYKRFIFNNKECTSQISHQNRLEFSEQWEKPLSTETRLLIKNTIYNIDDMAYVAGWKKIIDSFDRIELDGDMDIDINMCKICYYNNIDCKLQCACTEPNTCIDCSLKIVLDIESVCPFCRSLLDPFDIRMVDLVSPTI